MRNLYTSNTSPKGVAALAFLQSRNVELSVINLDDPAQAEAEHRLRLLIREYQHDDSADVVLPVLAQVESDGSEKILAIGFDPAGWEVL